MTRTHYKALTENRHLGQWDLLDANTNTTREATVEIEKVVRYVPPVKRKKKMPDGSMEYELDKRLEVSFRGKRKTWIAGPVSQTAIFRMYGKYIEDWIGKKITLYVDPKVKFGNDVTGGIRVRPSIPTGPVTTAALDAPEDPELRARQEAAATAAIGPLDTGSREPGED